MNNLFLDAEDLIPQLKDKNLLLIDICKESTYQQIHIPNAIHINYNDFVAYKKPIYGLLPPTKQFETVLGKVGWEKNKKLVCYDEEGGGMAGRFIWTCHAFNISNVQILNGGINNWYKQGFEISAHKNENINTNVSLELLGENVCNAEYILQNLNRIKIMDCRSLDEYQGIRKYANKGGHIPGAIHFDWLNIIDNNNNLKTHPFEQLSSQIQQLGFDKEDEIIVYCQTHHRSALNYTLLKHLGYKNVKGYHGSWSDWGNRKDTLIE